MTTRALEDSEIKALFDALSGRHQTRDKTLLTVGIHMALRATELCELKVGDVWDGQKARTYVKIRPETAKFQKGRTVRMGEKIRGVIADFIQWKASNGESIGPDAPLFLSQKGGHLTRTRLFKIMKPALYQAGIDQSPHCLRKTGATIFYLQSGYDLIATQHFLSHSDPATTRAYIGLTTQQMAEYTEKSSDHLIQAIETGVGDPKGNSKQDLLPFSDSDLLLELGQRGYDITPLMAQKRKQQLREASVISIDVA